MKIIIMENSTLLKQVLIGIVLVACIESLVAQSGPNYGGSAVNSNASNSTSWSNASDASDDDNDDDYAYVNFTCANQSDYLKVTNFGFSVPSGNTITGIQVGVEWMKTGGSIEDYEVLLVVGGSIASSGKSHRFKFAYQRKCDKLWRLSRYVEPGPFSQFCQLFWFWCCNKSKAN
jgi:hypothetical protein